jgi:hypothetical protein
MDIFVLMYLHIMNYMKLLIMALRVVEWVTLYLVEHASKDFQYLWPKTHPKNAGRVVSNFIIQALNGNDITIFGDGSKTRSFCYIDGLID